MKLKHKESSRTSISQPLLIQYSTLIFLKALKEYGVPLKYCRQVKAIYESAKVRVRLQCPGGKKAYSRSIPVKRGAIQGDIPSPICFLVALDKLLKDHGGLDTGIQLTIDLMLSDLEFVDDAGLANEETESATNRLTTLNAKGDEEAGMKVSIPKQKRSTSENDLLSLLRLRMMFKIFHRRRNSNLSVINAA